MIDNNKIYFYEHISSDNMSQSELDLLGFAGAAKFAIERGLDPYEVFGNLKNLEEEISQMGHNPFDMKSGDNKVLFDKWVDRYIEYFNNHAKHDKQAYVILGNIAAGKNTHARTIEQTTNSIIIDPDHFKMGKHTEKGFFEGFTSLYKVPTDRERMQDPCSDASKAVLKTSVDMGLNIILPKAAYSLEKLEKQLAVLVNAGYDIHLIQIEAPITDCADRSYYRYLIREYAKINDNALNNSKNCSSHGRFVPVSVITNIGDNSYKTFTSAVKKGKYASYSAFYNGGSPFKGSLSEMFNEMPIDIETMREL